MSETETQPRALPLQVALLVALLGGIAIAAFSNDVLPRLVSHCGRLVHEEIDDRALSSNQSRLELPAGKSWSRVETRFAVAPNEALSLVIGRGSGSADYTVVRLSALPSLASAALRFSGDRVVERQPLTSTSGAGLAQLERKTSGVAISVDGQAPVTVAAPPDATSFEVVLFPPSSPKLHDRLTLGAITLDDGTSLAPRYVREVLGSPVVLGGIVALLGFAARRRLEGWLARRFAHQLDHAPHAITACLVCAIALVALVMLIPRYELLPSFRAKERLLYRALLGVAVLACWLFARLREAVVRRFARARASRFFRPAFVPLQLVLTTAAVLLVFVALQFSFARFEPAEEASPGAGDAAIRIVALGGSQTRGYPYPKGWPGAFPSLLEGPLARGLGQPVAVWNFGVDSAGLDHIVEHLPARLAAAHPTHLLVDSIVNSAPGGNAATYRASLTRFLDATQGGEARLVMVKEPDLEPVYGHSRWPSIAGLYPVLDELAGRAGVPVIDPLPTLVAHRDEFLFLDDVHFTPHGHRVMADALTTALAPLLAAAAPAVR